MTTKKIASDLSLSNNNFISGRYSGKLACFLCACVFDQVQRVGRNEP